MAKQIYDARHVHLELKILTPQDWVAAQMRTIADWRAVGIETQPTQVNDPVYPRIEHGRWMFNCLGAPDCKSGVAAHPDWPEARCMGRGCGRVYTNLRFPVDRRAIEAVLVERSDEMNRNWDPRTRETVRDLEAENAANVPSEAKR